MMELLVILALVVLGLGVYAFKRMQNSSNLDSSNPQPYDPSPSRDPGLTRTEPDLWHKEKEAKPKPKPKKKKTTKKKAKKKAKKKSSGRKPGGKSPNMTIADKE